MTGALVPELVEVARRWAAAGFAVIPAATNGSKAPAVAWKQYQEERPSEGQLTAWFGGDAYDGLGLVCGAVSGQLEMFEAEGRAVADGTLEAFRLAMVDNGLEDLWDRLNAGYVELSPSGGMHWLYRVDGPACPNTRLARRPATAVELGNEPDEKVKVLLETRGEGGFVVVAPSGGRTHPRGKRWRVLLGRPDTIPVITIDERDALYAIAAMFDLMPVTVPEVPSGRGMLHGDGAHGNRPGDDFNARGSWDDILNGWTRARRFGGNCWTWVRPGKNPRDGISATTGRNDGDNLYVFSTSTEFEAEHPYSKFAAYTLLHYGGDYSAAASALRADGYGSPAPTPAQPADVVMDHEPVAIGNEVAEVHGGRTGHRPWQPVDLSHVLDGTWQAPEPTVGQRADGVGLFYPGKVHTAASESEGGKTWFALGGCLTEMDRGNSAVYLDFEDDEGAIVNRLLDMGAKPNQIRDHFTYLRPDAALGSGINRDDLAAVLADSRPTIVILDGVTEALALHGLDANKNNEVARFGQMLPSWIARRGPAVVSLDHVVKNGENRGRYAIGAVHKLNGIDGAAYVLENRHPFGVGVRGVSYLKLSKDRPGQLRRYAVTSAGRLHWFADLVVDATGNTGDELLIEVLAPSPTEDEFRPTVIMAEIMALVTEKGALPKRLIRKGVRGRHTTIDAALDVLVLDGYLTKTTPHSKLKDWAEQ
ncbi:bifunctional DNA primase/polymerase [Kribbella sp. CA-245084]|uniref:bifunctional DNA primase/polymerase n=1 Tax=Kribbella sp. CA-245084 TaxID=3239940 RepID=UPI003D935FDD